MDKENKTVLPDANALAKIPRRLVPDLLQWLDDEAARWPEDTAFQGDIAALRAALLRPLAPAASGLDRLLFAATPGPWAAEGQRVSAIAYVAFCGDGWAFAGDGTKQVISHERAEANARLVALAPELAARVVELEAALSLAHDYLAGNGWEGDPRMTPITAALTHARGQA